MATGKPVREGPIRRRVLVPLVLLVLAAGVAAGAWLWRDLRSDAGLAASYGARIGCSCRFVAGRDLSECRKDLEPGMALVRLQEDAAARSMTAGVPLFASQTARWRPGEGCRLDPWSG